jgi:uncharacterized protein YlxW (UPF0749 family)
VDELTDEAEVASSPTPLDLPDAVAAPVAPEPPTVPGDPAPTHQPHHRRVGRRGSVAVGSVLALAGLLFTANAHLAQTTNIRGGQDLAGLVEREGVRVDQLSAEVDALRVRVGALTDQQNTTGPVADPVEQAQTELAAGVVAVEGPGLTVQLSDAPAGGGNALNAAPDDLLVHQQDVQAVVDALWAGGAEAMSIQDQRVTATTAVRCVGNVLQLQGHTYSPPYVIKAIGDQRSLSQALSDSPDIRTYLLYVHSVGLGWSVTKETDIVIQAGVAFDLQYAHPLTPVAATPTPTPTPTPKTSSTPTPKTSSSSSRSP